MAKDAPDEHTVVVIGAGASVAEAKAHRPARDRDHPPLDANFFERVARHQDGPPLRKIVEHAERLGQPHLCQSSSGISLEQYLGRLFFEMNNRRNEANVHSYFDLVRLYTNELLTTTNWMLGRSGSMKRLFEKERQGRRKVTVVTFNHDLLVENALSLMSPRRHGNVWCLPHCYDLSSPYETCSNQAEKFDYDCPGEPDDHINILKLHGSVNWVFRTRGKYPTADFARRPRTLLLWTNKSIPPHIDQVTSNKRNWYLWPLIVPPIYEKHGLIRNELEGVWASASRALRDATRVVFWGYSFPRADLHARYFFQAAGQANASLRQPILINPDPVAHAELCAVLSPEKVTHYQDVAHYLTEG